MANEAGAGDGDGLAGAASDVTQESGPVSSEVRIRPAGPGDAQLVQDFVRRLSSEARRLRFHGVIQELDDDRLSNLIQADHSRRETLLAQACDAMGQPIVVGLADYEQLADGGAEASIVVADDWQRRGTAQALLRRLCESAGEHGLTHFELNAMTTNEGLRRLLEKLPGQLDAESAEDETINQLYFATS